MGVLVQKQKTLVHVYEYVSLAVCACVLCAHLFTVVPVPAAAIFMGLAYQSFCCEGERLLIPMSLLKHYSF